MKRFSFLYNRYIIVGGIFLIWMLFFDQSNVLNQVERLFENHNITKLDIKRMYRYLDKNVKKTVQDDESVTDE